MVVYLKSEVCWTNLNAFVIICTYRSRSSNPQQLGKIGLSQSHHESLVCQGRVFTQPQEVFGFRRFGKLNYPPNWWLQPIFQQNIMSLLTGCCQNLTEPCHHDLLPQTTVSLHTCRGECGWMPNAKKHKYILNIYYIYTYIYMLGWLLTDIAKSKLDRKSTSQFKHV